MKYRENPWYSRINKNSFNKIYKLIKILKIIYFDNIIIRFFYINSYNNIYRYSKGF